MHALVIEDEVAAVERVETALRALGYRSFDVAFSASEAIAFARRRCPDLITADLRLVDGSGIDAVREICSETPIPVIFITSVPAAEILSSIPDAIVVGKPFEPADVEGARVRALASPFSGRAG